MIKTTKQNWAIGATVKVGFLSLVVKAAIATPGDGLPDVYFLSNVAGTKFYQFTPYSGIESITVEQAAERVAEFRQRIEIIAAAETARAIKAAQIFTKFNEIFTEVA